MDGASSDVLEPPSRVCDCKRPAMKIHLPLTIQRNRLRTTGPVGPFTFRLSRQRNGTIHVEIPCEGRESGPPLSPEQEAWCREQIANEVYYGVWQLEDDEAAERFVELVRSLPG